jgi:hypothetical protein
MILVSMLFYIVSGIMSGIISSIIFHLSSLIAHRSSLIAHRSSLISSIIYSIIIYIAVGIS